LVIELREVTKSFGRARVVEDVSLTVERGEFFGLLGPNGAGKSTLIQVTLGLLAPDPGGVIRLFGEAVTPRSAVGLRGRVGVVGEAPQLRDGRTAVEYLAFFSRLYGLADDGGERVRARLAEAGLAEAAHKSIRTFSRGMKQRLALARALLHEPELLILDEPTSGLDPLGVRDARELLQARNRAGTTVFLCSHQLSEVEKSCGRVAVIHRGRLRAVGTTDEVAQGDLERTFVRLTGASDGGPV
jgi:ABC-2 type transport system ATP-binding protein